MDVGDVGDEGMGDGGCWMVFPGQVEEQFKLFLDILDQSMGGII